MEPKKILLVEDEALISDLYSYQLKASGYNVKTAPDGLTGLKLLEEEKPDLLLLDIMLPGMNGLEMLRQWKTKHPNDPLNVLLLTNLGQDAVIKEGFELGASGYLIKASYTPEQVVKEIQNAFAGKQAGNPNPNPPANQAPASGNSPAAANPSPTDGTNSEQH